MEAHGQNSSDSLQQSLHDDCPTLVHLAHARVQTELAAHVAFTFINSEGVEAESLSFAEVDSEARRLAVHMQKTLKKGDRVLLLFQADLNFIRAFLACLYAGVIAVPSYPPTTRKPSYWQNVYRLIEDADISMVLTLAAEQQRVQEWLQEVNYTTVECVAIEEVNCSPEDWVLPEISGSDIAFIQYTSGSTGLPKGVMVSHANLLANERLIQRCFGHNENTVFVGWLPLFHDMGLIGNVLQPFYLGIRSVLMEPLTFLRKPIRWLQAIDKYKATTSGAPNFAYQLCVDKISADEVQDLDLSSWSVAYNGSEPVQAATLEAFTEKFIAAGFKPEAMYPCYGMAETTLFVSGSRQGAMPVIEYFSDAALLEDKAVVCDVDEKHRRLVSAGFLTDEYDIAVVNPNNLQQCQSGQVGEIWLRGDSITQGYWAKPDTNQEIYQASIANHESQPDQRYFRTGDLGFVHDEQLYITGRLKDVVIIRGRNHYPQDIELSTQSSHEALQVHGCAAFSVEVENEERLVVIQEVKREHLKRLDADAVIEAIQQNISVQHEIAVHDVVLIKPMNLPKTTSGKVKRRQCKQMYLSGVLNAIAAKLMVDTDKSESVAEDTNKVQSSTLNIDDKLLNATDALCSVFERVLKLARGAITADTIINTLPIDSMLAVEIQQQAEHTLNKQVLLDDLFLTLSIAQLAQKTMANDSLPSTILPAQAGEQNPGALSLNQKSLLFLSESVPELPIYNIPVAFRVFSELNIPQLRQALICLLEKHPELQAKYIIDSGQASKQYDLSAENRHVNEFITVRDMAEANHSQLQAAIAADRDRAIRLQDDWRLHVYIYQCAAEESVILFSFHHIAVDLWSLMIVFDELSQLMCDSAVTLPVSKYSYADFVDWQVRWLQSPAAQEAKNYWLNTLSGELPVLNMPSTRSRPSLPSYRGDSISICIDPGLIAPLKALAKQLNTSLYAVLISAYQFLLHRYTGQKDIVVGSPANGRTEAMFADVVGYFVNPVILRSRLVGNPSFVQFLEQNRENIFAALKYQQFPLQSVLEDLKLQRSANVNAIFQTYFTFQKPQRLDSLTQFIAGESDKESDWGGLRVKPYPLGTSVSEMDLAMLLVETENGISGDIVYSVDLFDKAVIETFAVHYSKLLESLLAAPEKLYGEHKYLTDAEYSTIIQQWNDTQVNYQAPATCVHLQFEEHVKQQPEHPALSYQDKTLSYAELNKASNRLAHYLMEQGVGVDVPVGLNTERSLEMVIGILAILKAGGCYVPVDPEYPQQRIDYIVNNSGIRYVLKQASLPPLQVDEGIQLIELSDQRINDTQYSDENPEGRIISPQQLVYVIFTSGSTGQPKGVMNNHAGLFNRLAWMQAEYQLKGDDRVLQKTPFSFDVSVWEFLWPLSVGAQLVMAEPGGHKIPAYLTQCIADNDITTLHFVPSMLEVFLDQEDFPALDSIRRVICSGEALPPEVVEDFNKKFPVAGLHNLYGPTEASIDVSYWACPKDVSIPKVPIGKPIANTQLYILDEFFNPLAIGAVGELYIAGTGLARGYLARPDLTADRFIPDPFANEAGARMYKTGDLAKFTNDGTIEYLGRIDHQVKIRGFRIELGEIEAVLISQNSVKDAVVVVQKKASGDELLVAYVVPAQQAINKPELVAQLKEYLPEYMVPNNIVEIAEIPLSDNGKVDRKALISMNVIDIETHAYIAPKNQVQNKLIAIWADLLEVDPGKISITHNFFDIGGHSLLAVALEKAMSKQFGRKINVVEIFKYPTIEAQAAFLVDSDEDKSALTQLDTAAEVAYGGDIAVIGMSGRFPDADNVHDFWQNLLDGNESVKFYDDEHLLSQGINEKTLSDPNYVKAGIPLNNIEDFDAAFFDYTPREAALTDPQRRLMLECVQEALEDAGYSKDKYEQRISVYVGTGTNQYFLTHVLPRFDITNEPDVVPLLINADTGFTATQISYKLNLTGGSSISLNTACSTSLVCIDQACQSLRANKSDIAVAGGSTIFPDKLGYWYREGGILSPDAHCRAFDADANGTVTGSGAGVVILKRLDKALADGDNIHAIIKGTATNNDGSAKVSYTAPSIDGQSEVIKSALRDANISPETVAYIETHGTGTSLGDPIEIAALTEAYGNHAENASRCALGSVKTNIGHLDTAAGIAGFIKTVLSLKHKKIPPSINFEVGNPNIDFDNGPFYVNKQLQLWDMAEQPRRAAISSFGIGGTNAHVILEEAPQSRVCESQRRWQVLTLSAKTEAALLANQTALSSYIKRQSVEESELNLANIAYSLQLGRRAYQYRSAIVVDRLQAASEQLEVNRTFSLVDANKPAYVSFVFPGQGVQYPKMMHGLYQQEAVYRETIDHCAKLLLPLLGSDIRDVLSSSSEDVKKELEQTQLTQPLVFAVSYALAKLWQSWGVQPQTMMGHSIGEYVAACVAGVFSLEDALQLVAARGRLIQALPSGSMLAVSLGEEDILPYLNKNCSLAAVNNPGQCVIAGPHDVIASLQERLLADKKHCTLLKTSHAFHSLMLDPVLDEFKDIVEGIKRHAPKIPFVSNVTGTWISDEQAMSADYWVKHLRNTVRFADGVKILLADDACIALEVGPGNVLTKLIKANLAQARVVSSSKLASDQREDEELITQALAVLWSQGVKIDWQAVHKEETLNRISLPTYSFQRQRYWLDLVSSNNAVSELPGTAHRSASGDSPQATTSIALQTQNTLHPRPSIATAYVEPLGDTEKQLSVILGQLLGIDKIGRHDNYFELGGDSLLAVQIIAEVKKVFSLPFSIEYLFQYPTIEGISQELERLAESSRNQDEQSIVLVEGPERFELSPAQQRLWFLDSFDTGNKAVYNIPLALDISGALNVDALRYAFDKMLVKHESLRTIFDKSAESPKWQLHGLGYDFDIVDVEQTEVNAYLSQCMQHAFQLDKGPLLKVTLLKITEQRYVLLVNMHHIISDGWSLGVMSKDMVSAYKQYLTTEGGKQNVETQTLSIQYADYAYAQRKWLQSEDFAQQLAAWQENLTGAPALLSLPTDKSRPDKVVYEGSTVEFMIPAQILGQLKQISQQENVTLFMSLLAAFKVLLSIYADETDINIGTPVANRGQRELEDIVGFFINTLVLRTTINNSSSYKEILQQVKNTCSFAFSKQSVPFEAVVEALQPERNMAYSPLFQVMFVLQNTPIDSMQLPGISIKERPIHNGTAKFDLTLSLREEEEGVFGQFIYSTSLFDKNTIEQMSKFYLRLIEKLLAAVEQPIASLELADEHFANACLNDDSFGKEILNLDGSKFDIQNILPEGCVLNDVQDKKYVLNKQLELTSLGAAGSLYLSIEPKKDISVDGRVLVTEHPYTDKLGDLISTGLSAKYTSSGDIVVTTSFADQAAASIEEPHPPVSGGEQPLTKNEKLIAGIWQEMLSVESVTTADNFFSLGGHSLLATAVLMQLNMQLDEELEIRALFEYPVLKDLAGHLDSLVEVDQSSDEEELII